MLNLTLKIVAVIALLLVIALSLALKDSPSRPAAGEAHQLELGSRQIEYFTAGPQGGKAVVLLASYARSVADFNELLPTLHDAGYRSIAIQARGIDGSSLVGLRPTLFDYADDVRAVLDAEGVGEPVTLIGHAFGNRIARAFASRYPQKRHKLILLAAGEGAPPPAVSRAISTVVFGLGTASQRDAALHRAFFSPQNQAPDYWRSGWYPMAALAQAYATANTPAEQWRAAGQAAIVVIEPQDDAAASGAGERLQRQFPQRVKLLHLEGAGHAMLPERAERIREMIADALTDRVVFAGSH
ncbi:alpha/beta fold hydrolase [Spongiibacter sp.]|uniref:alpha/beta fold hydrolase n=1 Tax=Spongiibacter sp. TaxID=2024860 RepID=UPI003567ACBC